MGKRKNKNQERKKKITLVFDENKRKDFLCGFRKRKLERKKKAQEELQRMLKEEKKRIKQENKEAYKKLVVSSRPIPDIEQLLQEEYEDDDVNVKIVELSSDVLQKKDLVIGENKPTETTVKRDTVCKKSSVEVIPGMATETENEKDESEVEENTEIKLKTKKEIKKILKKQATKKIQKSKAFQLKSNLEKVQNKKKSQQKKRRISAKSQSPKDSKKSKNRTGRRRH